MPNQVPPAIYCYSKSGHTRRAASAVAAQTTADLIPVEVGRYRVPLFWIARAIWDVGRQIIPPLQTGNVVPVERPWIVVAGPVWADQPAPPVRSVLRALSTTAVPIGLLTTSGRAVDQVKCVRTCEAELGRKLAAAVNIPNEIDQTEDMAQHLASFAAAMQSHATSGAA